MTAGADGAACVRAWASAARLLGARPQPPLRLLGGFTGCRSAARFLGRCCLGGPLCLLSRAAASLPQPCCLGGSSLPRRRLGGQLAFLGGRLGRLAAFPRRLPGRSPLPRRLLPRPRAALSAAAASLPRPLLGRLRRAAAASAASRSSSAAAASAASRSSAALGGQPLPRRPPLAPPSPFFLGGCRLGR